jgi:hypothetical protein
MYLPVRSQPPATLPRAKLLGCVCLLAVMSIFQRPVQGQRISTLDRFSQSWSCYTIDDSLCGADGVKLADINADGLVDIVVGWEESGQVRVYLHPGHSAAHGAWPKIEAGAAPAVEDAVFADLNADGQLDVLSCCEGQEKTLRAHFNPGQKGDSLIERGWVTRVIPSSRGRTRWMFAEPLPSSETHLREAKDALKPRVPDMVVGSKNPNGQLGILRTGTTDLADWKIETLTKAEWIMSIEICDMDADGDADILYSDRKGSDSGVYWLENPSLNAASQPATSTWQRHSIGAMGSGEVMFLDVKPQAVLDNGVKATPRVPVRIYTFVKPNRIYQFDRPTTKSGEELRSEWDFSTIDVEPRANTGRAKGIAAGDLDGDGRDELVLSFEGAEAEKWGVVYLKQDPAGEWKMCNVSGTPGIKYDLIELLDLDGDGDLDVLTCEEREADCGLGVIWYANPRF